MTDSSIDSVRRDETSSSSAHAAPEPVELGLAMTRIFKTPLAALRASMESLAKNLETADPRRETLAGALAEVTRLARDVEALAAYAAPRPLMPLWCSLEELLQGSMSRLAPRDAARVTLARPGEAPKLYVDGPVLSTTLAHVVRVALESSGEDVLLEARTNEECASFSILSGANGARVEALATPSSHHDASLGLGLELARRDVTRMGGTFQLDTADASRVRVLIRVPREPASLVRRSA